MSHVNINYGPITTTVSPDKIGVGCIIGRTTNNVGLINNVTVSTITVADDSYLPTGTGGGQLMSSDQLYKAAQAYFRVHPTGTLVLVGINPSASLPTIPDNLFKKFSDTVWNGPYSPVSIWSTVDSGTAYFRVKLTAAGAIEAETNDEDDSVVDSADAGDTMSWDTDTWYYVPVSAVVEETAIDGGIGDTPTDDGYILINTTNDKYNGKITLTDGVGSGNAKTKLKIGQNDDGSVDSYISFTNIAKIMGHPNPSVLGYYIADMAHHTVDFDIFCFGYDATLGTQSMYDTTECVSATDAQWLQDVLAGSMIVNQLFGLGQRCMFFHGIPNGVSIAGSMDTYYDADDHGYTFDQIHSLIGDNANVASFYMIQYDGVDNSVDFGVAAMATYLQGAYRQQMTFRVTPSVPIEGYPQEPIAELWKDVRVNPYVQIRATGTAVWGSNLTHGAGSNDKRINYVMCRHILANKSEKALYDLLFTRTLHIDLRSMERVERKLLNVQAAYVGKYLDSIGSVDIPLKEYIKNDNTVAIQEAKDAETIGDVSIGFGWGGNIEYFTISGFYGG